MAEHIHVNLQIQVNHYITPDLKRYPEKDVFRLVSIFIACMISAPLLKVL